MKLKKPFLSLPAVLAMGMATTTAWGAIQTTEVTLQGNAANGYYVNMPERLSEENIMSATLEIPDYVKTFKVYDDGGANGPFTSTSCGTLKCSERLIMTPPDGFFIHLKGSLTSNTNEYDNKQGSRAYLYVYNGTTISDATRLLYVRAAEASMNSWTRHEMLLDFYSTNWSGTNAAGLDLTVEVALDLGADGLGAYSFTDGVDHLEMHASPSTNKIHKTTTLTSPAGTMMYLTFDDVLAEGDTVAVLNGESNSTDTLLKVTNATNNDVVYIPNNKATICVATNDDGLDDVLRATAYVLTKNAASTAGVDFYKNEATGYTVVKISDIATGTVSIPSPVNVDAIVYGRTFKANTRETIVLPFQLPAGATTNAKFYYLQKVVQQEGVCAWMATLKRVSSPKANKPYAIIIDNDDTELRIDLNGGKATFQTTETVEYSDQTGNWIFKGLYQNKIWGDNDNEIGLAYALAKEDDEDGLFRAGQFVKIGGGTTAAPMRAYMRKKNADVRLSRPLAKGEVSSIEDMPEVIDVELVDEDEKPMAIGRMNTVTGAVQINRWIDLKGRSTNPKPTTKGVFFNKKGIAK